MTTEQPTLIVRSPVRISFAGGGTDLPSYYKLYGGAVLSVAIDKYLYTRLRRRDDGRVQVSSSTLQQASSWHDLCQLDLAGTDLEIPVAAMKYFGCDLSLDLSLTGEVPPGTGLGSSASICVNVLKALSTHLRRPLSNYELAETAYRIARHTLNKPIGKQDEYGAAFGGLNFIRFHSDERTEVEALNLSPELTETLRGSLMLFFTGATHSSWEILQEQERQTAGNGAALNALHAIRELADDMRAALTAGDLDAFGAMLHEGWMQKKSLSRKISNSRIDSFYRTARQAGALGGKITGAGGGGFLLLFCPPAKQERVRRALEKMGLKQMDFHFDMQGTRLLENSPAHAIEGAWKPKWAPSTA